MIIFELEENVLSVEFACECIEDKDEESCEFKNLYTQINVDLEEFQLSPESLELFKDIFKSIIEHGFYVSPARSQTRRQANYMHSIRDKLIEDLGFNPDNIYGCQSFSVFHLNGMYTQTDYVDIHFFTNSGPKTEKELITHLDSLS